MNIFHLILLAIVTINNIKVVLNLSGYLRKDDKTLVKKEDLDYFYGKSYFDGKDGVQVKKEYFRKLIFDSMDIMFTTKYGDPKYHQMKHLLSPNLKQ